MVFEFVEVIVSFDVREAQPDRASDGSLVFLVSVFTFFQFHL